MDDAAELADRIEALADWSSIEKEMPPGSDLYPKVRDVIDRMEEATEPRP